MKGGWLLDAASLLAPRDQRAGWLEEWRSELWYIPSRRAPQFCLGAFRDALWVRRNSAAPARRPFLESPVKCIAVLAAFAALSLAVTRLCAPEMNAGCVMMIPFSCVLLPLTHQTMGRGPAGRHPAPGRLRGWAFLALKIALVQPVMFCAFIVFMHAGPAAPFGLWVVWFLTPRWVLEDQRRRCPVCLRLMSSPVRIGAASRTFLEWYGADSMCSRGHGLLHIPEVSTIYSLNREWLALDDLYGNRSNDETRTAQYL